MEPAHGIADKRSFTVMSGIVTSCSLTVFPNRASVVAIAGGICGGQEKPANSSMRCEKRGICVRSRANLKRWSAHVLPHCVAVLPQSCNGRGQEAVPSGLSREWQFRKKVRGIPREGGRHLLEADLHVRVVLSKAESASISGVLMIDRGKSG
jgi:hypothetical protein